MDEHHELVRALLTAHENGRVTDGEVDESLERALRQLPARSRVDLAAQRVFAGPRSTRVPPLESLPLKPTPLTRAEAQLRSAARRAQRWRRTRRTGEPPGPPRARVLDLRGPAPFAPRPPQRRAQ
ncbi:hypothetical protein [Vallicoccus soli]|uniref:Uncharacterized protein n=1 Tax=Vallicoccus soli TaxID=2339232 RepID=A0A3A3ZN35_9ACTN|nr:hypothetical protein [Vallicoccus soli]RJK98175.1 hypothetical protein D5H78_04510 [Vallicoccus soli]